MIAGVRNIPPPIVDPTSTATALQSPSRRGKRSPKLSTAVPMVASIYISRPMPRRFAALAWTAAAATYVLIVLGAIVRISGSGLGCGNDWPVCHGRLIPPLSDTKTFIEWNHRLFAGLVTILVALLAVATWKLRRRQGAGSREQTAPGHAPYVALGLLVVQILLGGIVVKQDLQP